MFLIRKKKTPLKAAIEYFSKKNYIEPYQINIKYNGYIILQIFYAWPFREINKIEKYDLFAILIDDDFPKEIISSMRLNHQKSIENKTIIFLEKKKNKLEKTTLVILEKIFNQRKYNDDIGFDVEISSPK